MEKVYNSSDWVGERIAFYESRNIKHKKAVEFAFRDLRRMHHTHNEWVLKKHPIKDDNELPF